MKEPIFREAEDYFYDVDNNIIYGRNKGSKSYYHEVSHYIDHLNPKYRKFSHFMSVQEQSLKIIFPILAIISIFTPPGMDIEMFSAFLILYGVISAFTVQEEIRAQIRGNRLWKQAQKIQK